MKRITNAIKIGWWAFKNPLTINSSNFKMLSDLLAMIFRVANKNENRMAKIAYIHPTEGEQEIVSIWAGAGIAADPYDRITELISENRKLKIELAKQIKNK